MKIILSEQLNRYLIGKFVKCCYILFIALLGYLTYFFFGKLPGDNIHFIWKFILYFIQGLPAFFTLILIKVVKDFIAKNIFIQWK